MRLNPLRHQLAATSPLRLADIVASARTPSRGLALAELRELLAREHDAAGVVLCGSGTQALFLALEAARWLAGEDLEVVLPAFTCFDVASAAVRFGQPITFYDLDPRTLGPDSGSLSKATSRGAHVAVLASLYGIPVDWETVGPILDLAGSFVIEDAAQGHGASWRGAPLGGRGRIGVRSFGRGKGWTGGAGGAVLIRDLEDWQAVADRLERALSPAPHGLAVLARSGAHWALGRPSIYRVPRSLPGLGLGETRYHELSPPHAMPEAAARLALRTKEAADLWSSRRRDAAEQYRATALERHAAVDLVDPPPSSDPGYIRFPIIPRQGMGSFGSRAEAARLGAAPSYPIMLPRLAQVGPLVERRGGALDTRFPGAGVLEARLVTLPTHPLTTDLERDRLIRLLETS